MSTLYVDNIYSKTGTSQALEIDSDGRVLMPVKPAFHVYRNAGDVGATATIVFNEAELNQGNHYSTSTGLFTAPVAGIYYFSAFGMKTNNTQGDLGIRFIKNGTAVIGTWMFQSDGASVHIANHISGAYDLAANDTMGVQVTHSTFYAISNRHNSFSGFFVG